MSSPLVALLVAAAAPAAEPAPTPRLFRTPVVRQYDLTYSRPDGEDLQLDLARPKAGGPFPCVVCLHGGAWKAGSRKDLSEPFGEVSFGIPGASLIEVLADRGFAAASVSYRLAPKSRFPAQIADAKTAVRYLRAHAKELNLDPTRIAALGFSAGGHLAALVGTTDRDPEFDGPLYPAESSRVSCVVDFFGPADLSLYAATPAVERIFFRPLLGALYREKPLAYAKASPVSHVSRDDPPFLIVHGTADLVVPMLHSERLHEKLLEVGVKSVLLPMPLKGHGWFGPDAAKATGAAVRFLAEHLAPPEAGK